MWKKKKLTLSRSVCINKKWLQWCGGCVGPRHGEERQEEGATQVSSQESGATHAQAVNHQRPAAGRGARVFPRDWQALNRVLQVQPRRRPARGYSGQSRMSYQSVIVASDSLFRIVMIVPVLFLPVLVLIEYSSEYLTHKMPVKEIKYLFFSDNLEVTPFQLTPSKQLYTHIYFLARNLCTYKHGQSSCSTNYNVRS